MELQPGADWWRNAVIYQIYPRSFADGNGDGTGDLLGVISRLDYLAALGVDAIWFSPWYVSPLADGGYDIADYRNIDPQFGTIAQAETLIAAAGELGIRVIIDVVPNHISNEHPWFQAALAAAPGSPERARFWFLEGAGPTGDTIPTNWQSSFQGGTWTRTTNPDGTPGQWYLHLFTPEQPDWNWNHPDIQQEHLDILRFWFDRGVAGVRIDSATLLIKDPTFPEASEDPQCFPPGQHPYIDRDAIHDVYRSWRAVADEYDPPRVLVGEIWLADTVRFANYLRPDEMHTAFNFDFMARAYSAPEFRASIDATLAAHAGVGAPATWVLSNHDVTRPVTRYGRDDTAFTFATKRFNTPTDLELGTKRARVAALITTALPGCLYLYQGDELGLPEGEELPLEVLQDPMHFRSGGVDPGRDGCRIPLPWATDATDNFGFSAATAAAAPGATSAPSWLPQPSWWGGYSVQAETDDPASMLCLYRKLIALKHGVAELADGVFGWLDGYPDDVLAFRRGALCCVANLGSQSCELPANRTELIRSAVPDNTVEAPGGAPTYLEPDTAVWFTV
ncbi:MAG: glycoside hydrolase family 13 protein [Propionibacteriaceae bacterium]|nr:glycoside hydrolase family 13 protein [Propionibacteriaceae bacterium]